MRAWLVLWLGAAAGGSDRSLVFMNGLSRPLDILWVPADGGAPVPQGQLPPAQPSTPGQSVIGTYKGHSFRLREPRGEFISGLLTHDGGRYNLVAVAVTGQPSLLAAGELRRLVSSQAAECGAGPTEACVKAAGLRAGGIVLPEPLVDQLWREYDPARMAPRVVPPESVRREAGPQDRLVLLNRADKPVTVGWLWLDPEDSAVDGFSPESSVMPASDSVTAEQQRGVGSVPAGVSGSASVLMVRASPGQRFLLSTGSGRSLVADYGGEMAIVDLFEHGGQLNATVRTEDQLKMQLGRVADDCLVEQAGHDWPKSKPGWSRCVSRSLRVESVDLDLGSHWFRQLWGSPDHWWLCNHRPAARPLANISIQLSGRTLSAEVFRREPLLVMMIHGVASTSECALLAERGMKGLGMAHVAGGGHSRTRRTLSKDLYPDLQDDDSLVTQIARRFFELTSVVTGFDLKPEGQEPINWLHYLGGYEYRPHCDGGCGQHKVRKFDRVATTLLYCQAADEGGSTVFTRDPIRVVPRAGSMLLFTYDSDPTSLSEHAACPVLAGTKSTATQWYREGVSLKRNWEGKPVRMKRARDDL